jgi:hypothetical protein
MPSYRKKNDPLETIVEMSKKYLKVISDKVRVRDVLFRKKFESEKLMVTINSVKDQNGSRERVVQKM